MASIETIGVDTSSLPVDLDRIAIACAQSGNCVEVGAFSVASACSAGGQCIEVGAWNKSSAYYCGTANCVETPTETPSGHVVRVRDAKESKAIGENGQPVGDTAQTLEFSLPAWDELITTEQDHGTVTITAAVRVLLEHTFSDNTTFVQVPDSMWRSVIESGQEAEGNVAWAKSDQQDTVLTFNLGEISAWGEGVTLSEFGLSTELREEMLIRQTAVGEVLGRVCGMMDEQVSAKTVSQSMPYRTF